VAINVVTIWSAIALIVGLIVAALIRNAERLHKEEVLIALFMAVSDLQATR
jgi:hypothetical protein